MSKTVVKLFGGVEGGGTKTICSIITECGETVCKETTGPTNPWLLGNDDNQSGFEVAAYRIHEALSSALDKLNSANDKEYKLEAVVCALF